MSDFADELELFRTEEEVAQQYFFGYLALQSIPGRNPAVLDRMNDHPLFWITTRHALLLSAFVALWRIFDQDPRSIHHSDKLLRSVWHNIGEFTRAELAKRKITGGLDPAAAYVVAKCDLTPKDVGAMRKEVAAWRKVYEARYREIRHGVFAHKGLISADSNLLMAQTNIEEMKPMLGSCTPSAARYGSSTTTVGRRT
ncbi:hypothetical protein SAMN05216374_3210 [Tardiphaga sp. OK246]|uniref:AbiU2 domain-containing protein n=1 Tax=Tardiphaga sp. OK246 TaxID=1855307 RepID=UPI000B6A24F0|nr:hypothetical protein [Tardiphaga sp. OK246]SNT32880.1 hypothetical protein SAMN05216374_3210 [Tardiphaga sp. OK246]